MSELVKSARIFTSENSQRITANRLPKQQPFEVHLKSVAEIVSSVTDQEEVIAAAWLHEIVEDTPVTAGDVEKRFGAGVARLVGEVTPVSRLSDGDRAARFALDKKHFAQMSPLAKTIKLADLIDTTRDLYKSGDPSFGTAALEAGELAGVLVGGDAKLLERLRRDLDKYRAAFRVTGNFTRSPERSPLTVSLNSLRVFGRAFTAQDVAEPLLSFDFEHDAVDAMKRLCESNIHVAGIRKGGFICGYLERSGTTEGSNCGEYVRQIDPSQTIEGSDSLTDVVEVLTRHDWCFVTVLGTVAGVISRAHLQKPAMRMWLFGIITVAEQEFTERVRQHWPREEWLQLLPENRVEKAKQLLAERKRRNEQCALLDCLQLGDKLDLLSSDGSELEALGFSTSGAAKRVIKQVESLRNRLAHSQDFVEEDWPQIVRLARRVEELVQAL